MTNTEAPIIFFDGVCNFCNRSIQIILKNDKQQLFRFASLQSDFTNHFFEVYQYQKTTDSIILFYKGQFYDRSDAVLMISLHLQFPFFFATTFFIVPRFIRNPLYSFIAARRYKWFGKRDSCMVPDAAVSKRFLG